MPAPIANFNAVGNGFSGPSGTFTVSSAPPDPDGAVGPNHFVNLVNTDFAVFNKSGVPIFGPVATNTLWSGFGGGCETNNDGDGVVLYDRAADRFVFTQFSVASTPYLYCVAVSQTPDPTGAYFRYSFSFGNTEFPDYPKISAWPDAYYATFNIFANGSTFSGGRVCALDRAKMLVGQPPAMQCFDTGANFGGLLASDVDGPTAPPTGSPNYLLALGANANELAFWKFHVDWTTPASSTLTGPTTLATAAFTEACGGGTCIPQLDTTQQLDSLADRLMFRLAYRNFGDHEAMVTNHAVTAGSGTGIRWYEIRGMATTPTLFQQGTYAPDANYRWMGSIAMDQSGDIAVGFSLSGSALHPEIHYAGRLASDPLGTLAQGEATIIDGAGSQQSGLSRWGDYSALVVDPSDDCTFWYTNQYIPADGTFNWSTRVASFRYPSCGLPPPPLDFTISASPGSLNLAQGASGTSAISTAVVGSAGTVNLAVSGTPSGATATLAATSVSAGAGTTLTVHAGTAAPGTYSIVVTGTEGSATHSTTVSLTVETPAPGITNGGFETGNLSGWTHSGPAAGVSTTAHTGKFSAKLGSTKATNGTSSISQSFTAPTGTTKLTFWYQVHCPDTTTRAWATASLKDVTANTSHTVLPKTCNNHGTWATVSATVTAGHKYTVTLSSRDDNDSSDATYTLYDDVTVH
jgi:hypothetical protein